MALASLRVRKQVRARRGRRLALEALEDRTLPSGNQTLGTALALTFQQNVAAKSGYLAGPDEADLFRFSLGSGDVVLARVDAQDAGSTLDSALRLFDGTGRPIALNDGFNGRDPELTFQAATAGTYYLGVSAAGNTAYDPRVRDSGTGRSTGLYALSLTRLQINAPLVPDLVGAAFQVSAQTAAWGDALTVSYTIENRGGAAAGGFDTTVVIATNNGLTDDVLPLGSFHLDGLAADTSTSGTLTLTLPGAPAGFPEPGTIYLGLEVDSHNTAASHHAGANGALRQGMNEAALTIVEEDAAAVPNGSPSPFGLEARASGQLGSGQSAEYQLTASASGRLTARVQGAGVLRLSLYDAQGDLLIQSDGQGPASLDPVLDQHLDPAGTDAAYLLQVTDLAGGGSYTLTTQFQPALPPGQPLPVGAEPLAVVSGDFNGDGVPDLAVADGYSGDVRVFLGTGDGTFATGQEIAMPAGGYPTSLAVGAFTGDGRLDLAVANSDGVTILLGQGDGTFQVGQTLAAGKYPSAVVAGDFTGDGIVDIAAADSGSNDVRIFLGNGDGSFHAGQVLTVGSSPTALVCDDFNHDGRTDLAVAAQTDDSVDVLLGNGDGTFHAGQSIAVGSNPLALAAGDFRGSGQTDLAVADQGSDDVRMLLGNGDGSFRAGQVIAVGRMPQSIMTGDFTGTGRIDLAVPDYFSGDVRVLLNQGGGMFRVSQIIPAGNIPDGSVAGDFRGDGRLDLAIVNVIGDHVTLIRGNGDGTFQTPPPTVGGQAPVSVAAGDFTGDGRLDLAVLDNNSGDLRVLLGNGDGTFQGLPPINLGGYPFAVVAGDFNGDGRTDLAVADGGAVTIFLGNGDGTFHQGQTVIAAGESMVEGDFTGDGRLDLAVADEFANTVTILLGNGDGTFQVGQTLTVGQYASSLVVGDFTGDGHADLAVTTGYNFYNPIPDHGDVTILVGQGDGTFQVGQSIVVGKGPVALAAGDFSGSGHLDLAVADAASDDVRVLLGQGDGTFQTGQIITGLNYPYALAAGDFSGNGRLDLAVADRATAVLYGGVRGDVRVLLGQGDGTFQLGQAVPVGINPECLVAGPFTGPGHLDLAVANFGDNSTQVLVGGGAGTFAPAPAQEPPPAPSRPYVADLRGAGIRDLIIRGQSGTILYRAGIPAVPGIYLPPVVVNPGAPARDMTIVPTSQGMRIATLSADGRAITLYGLQPDGSFAVTQTLPVVGDGVRIAAGPIGDSAGDGLVVTTAVSDQALVYRSQADGTFLGPVYRLPIGAAPANVQFADVTGGGFSGLIVADQDSGEASVYLDDPAHPFASVEQIPVGGGPYGLTATGQAVQATDGTNLVLAGRFDEADRADLVALNSTADEVSLLRGTAFGGFFAPEPALALGFAATDMVAADFTGDGHLDLAVLDPQHDRVVVYAGDGMGRFTRVFSTSAGRDPSGLAVADVNGDGIRDLLVGSATGDVLVLVGKGDGTFRPSLRHFEVPNVALASFVGSDGTFYFVSANRSNNLVTVQDQAGQTTFTVNAGNGLDGPSAVAAADLNGDGVPDLLVANTSANELLVFLGTGPGQFAATPLAVPVGTYPDGITVANLTRGGVPDVIVANNGSNTLSIFFGQGRGNSWTLVGGPQLATGPGPVATVVADVTGPHGRPDGIPDITVSNSQGNTISVLRGLGFGYFADNHPTTLSTGPNGLEPGELFLGHFGGRGLDLVTLNLGSGTLSYFADFPRHLLTAVGPSRTLASGGLGPVAAVTKDLAGGYSELIVANTSGTVAFFDGGPSGLTLARTVRVPVFDVTTLALGAGGTLLVGGLGGVVAVPLEPAALPAGSTTAVSGVTLGAASGTVGITAAPTGQSAAAVAALPSPPVGQTSGTAGLAEASGPGGMLSGAGIDTVGGLATDTAAISLGAVLDLTPGSGPAVREQVAAALLTGAKPSARLLPQRGGASVAPVPSLTRDEEDDSARPVAADEDQSPPRMVGFSYTDVLAPAVPMNVVPAGNLPAGGETRLGTSACEEDWPWAPGVGETAAEALVLALIMSGGLDARRGIHRRYA